MKSLPVPLAWQGYPGRLAVPNAGRAGIPFAASQSPVQACRGPSPSSARSLRVHECVRLDGGSPRRGRVWFSGSLSAFLHSQCAFPETRLHCL